MHGADLISGELERVRRMCALRTDGEVATYIPELATADPDLFGIAVASRTGGVYTAGDADVPFTIQSVSKPFVYAMALTQLGLDPVLARVGAEPSGEAFNAISLEPDTGRPANPMINAGAIVTTSLIAARDADGRFEHIRAVLSAFAGHELEMDERVYRSEWETGDTNRALAWLMRSAGSLDADVDATLDVYFRQCAVLVTARDIAVMAATLANGGVNPATGETVVNDEVASQVLTVMATCGMYDASGEWLLRVGLPAKSGVAGAVIAASPGQYGIGLFSPRLDARGNSVRAVAACETLSDRFDLHLMRQPNRSVSAVSATAAPGKANGGGEGAVAVRGLRGDIAFADVEELVHSLDVELEGAVNGERRSLALDLTAVRSMCAAARALIAALARELVEAGIPVAVASGDPGLAPAAKAFPSLDAAIRWCEEERHGAAP